MKGVWCLPATTGGAAPRGATRGAAPPPPQPLHSPLSAEEAASLSAACSLALPSFATRTVCVKMSDVMPLELPPRLKHALVSCRLLSPSPVDARGCVLPGCTLLIVDELVTGRRGVLNEEASAAAAFASPAVVLAALLHPSCDASSFFRSLRRVAVGSTCFAASASARHGEMEVCDDCFNLSHATRAADALDAARSRRRASARRPRRRMFRGVTRCRPSLPSQSTLPARRGCT